MAICSVNLVGCQVTEDHLHMPGQAFWFFCLKLFLQHIQINSFITYIYVCSFHHFHEMCACTISLHIDVINILLLSHYSYRSL